MSENNYEQLWESVDAFDRDKGFEPIPDGNYTAVVNKAEFLSSNEPPVIRWEFIIKNQGYMNRRLWKESRINEKTVQYIKADFMALGLSVPAKLANIPDSLALALNRVIDVGVKAFTYVNKAGETKLGSNVYINGLKDIGPIEEVPF